MKNRILTVDPDDVYEMSLAEEEKKTLRRLCMSNDDADRKLFLDWVEVWSLRGEYGPLFIPLLAELVRDADEDTRFEAVNHLGCYCEAEPELVWQALLGLLDDEALFPHLSAFILEHLLEHHADTYFPLVRERIVAGDRAWWLLLRGCYLFGQMAQREDEVAALLDRYAEER